MSAYAALVAEHPLPWRKEKALLGWWRVLDAQGNVVSSAIAQVTGSPESEQLVDLIIEAANRLGTNGAWVPLRDMESAPKDGTRVEALVYGEWEPIRWSVRREAWYSEDDDRAGTPSGWIDTADLPTPVTGGKTND